MTNLRTLKKSLEKTERKYIGKIIYSLFFMMILQSLISSLIISPIMRKMIPNTQSGDILSYILITVSGAIYLLFQFGFAAMLLRMVRNEFVTLGFIFYGFKKLKLTLPPIIAFLAMFAVVLALSRIFFNFVFEDFIKETNETIEWWNNSEGANGADREILISQLKLYAIPTLTFLVSSFFLVLIPFVFTFQFRLDNPNKSVFWSMKQSLNLIFNDFNFFRLIAFGFLASWKRLVISIIIMGFIITSTTSGLGIMAFVLSFAYFLNSYTALIQIQLTVPTMYHELTRKHEVGETIQIEV